MITERTALNKALTAVNRLKRGEQRLPILDACHIQAVGGTCTVRRTNLDTTVYCYVPCTGDITPALVDLQTLRKALKGLKGTVTLEQVDGALMINGVLHVETLPVEDYPEMPELAGGERPVDLQKLHAVAQYVSKDKVRRAIQYIHATPTHVEATDGHMYIRYNGDWTAGEYKLPVEPVRIARQSRKTADWYIGTNDKYYWLTTDGMTVVGRYRDAEYDYPDMEALIAKAPTPDAVGFDVPEVWQALETIAPLTDGMHHQITLDVGDGCMTLRVDTSSVVVDCTATAPIMVSFNAVYLLQLLQDTGAACIHYDRHSTTSMWIVYSADCTGIIMPLKR